MPHCIWEIAWENSWALQNVFNEIALSERHFSRPNIIIVTWSRFQISRMWAGLSEGPQGQQQNVAQLGWEAWNSAGRRCPWKQYLLAKVPFSNLIRFIHKLRIENMQGMYQHKPLWGQHLVERQSTSFAKNLSCRKIHCKTWKQILSQIWHCTWRLSHRKW